MGEGAEVDLGYVRNSDSPSRFIRRAAIPFPLTTGFGGYMLFIAAGTRKSRE